LTVSASLTQIGECSFVLAALGIEFMVAEQNCKLVDQLRQQGGTAVAGNQGAWRADPGASLTSPGNLPDAKNVHLVPDPGGTIKAVRQARRLP
jgi:hypothetical protein